MTSLLIRLFVKNCDDVKNNGVRQNYGTLGSLVGIVCNLLLCILKIAVGFITGSISIVADGFNNLTDMGSSVITMIGFKLAGKPADSDHPFGHGRMEYMSAFLVAIIILLVGFELFKSSLSSLISGNTAPKYPIYSIVVLVASVLIKFWLSSFNRKIGKKISSDALIATAQDSLNDSIATTVILISVLISKFIDIPFNLDAVMGIAVALFILYSGIMSAKDTINQILGTPPDAEVIEEIENTILAFDEFVGIHDLIVHNYGPGRQFASVHIEVPQDTNIVKCHEQIDLCEKLICEKTGVMTVIHMDPIDVDNEEVNKVKAEITNMLTLIDSRLTLHDFRMTPISDRRTNLIFDVVVPSPFHFSHSQLITEIERSAKLLNPTFCCVITVDTDFTGK